MAFFKRVHKKLALTNAKQHLQSRYMDSENMLIAVSKLGNEKEIKKAMQEHSKYEYALLYQITPEFKKKAGKK